MSERFSNRTYVTFLSALLFAALLALGACNDNGDNPQNKEEKENTVPVAKPKVTDVFKGEREALSYALTIFVDQPGPGGSAATWFPKGFMDVDGGHAYVKLECLNTDSTSTSLTVGFYPKVRPRDPNNPIADGELRDDTGRHFEVSKKYPLTKPNFDKALAYIDSVELNKVKYHLNDYNCADFVIRVGRAAGENVPDTYGTWDINFGMGKRLTGGGSNPGNLGQDLRQ